MSKSKILVVQHFNDSTWLTPVKEEIEEVKKEFIICGFCEEGMESCEALVPRERGSNEFVPICDKCARCGQCDGCYKQFAYYEVNSQITVKKLGHYSKNLCPNCEHRRIQCGYCHMDTFKEELDKDECKSCGKKAPMKTCCGTYICPKGSSECNFPLYILN